MLKGSYISVSNGVDPMTVPSLLGYFSFWMLLVLAWKPIYYLIMYFYGVVTKNTTTPVTYGALLHTWITQLWGLVL